MRRRLALPPLLAAVMAVPLVPTAPSWAATPQPRPTDSSCPAGVVPGDDFLDVPTSDVHEASVDCVVHWGVATGRTAALYVPGAAVTREQMASFVARALLRAGADLPPASGDAFTDDDTSSHEDDIDRLAQAGVVTGTGPGTYSPQRPVTRAQMAALLVRAYDYRAAQVGHPDLQTGGDYFPDDDGQPLEPQVDAAARAGFAGGYPDGTYRPGLGVPRDQMATFLARLLDALVDDLGAAVPPAPPVAPLDGRTPVTARGAGAAQVGLTLRQVQAATGRTWSVDYFEDGGGYCYYAEPTGLEQTFYAIVEAAGDQPPADPLDGVLTAMNTSNYMDAPTGAGYGLRPGDSLQHVRDVVGTAATFSHNIYTEHGVYVDLDSPDAPGRRLRLEVGDSGVVENVHGGTTAAASYVEGCL